MGHVGSYSPNTIKILDRMTIDYGKQDVVILQNLLKKYIPVHCSNKLQNKAKELLRGLKRELFTQH